MQITSLPKAAAASIARAASTLTHEVAELPQTITSTADSFISGGLGTDSAITQFANLAKGWKNSSSGAGQFRTAGEFGVTNLANGNSTGINPFANANKDAGAVFGAPRRDPIGTEEHKGGGFQNTGYVKRYKTEAEAKKAFAEASQRLLHPSDWELIGPDKVAPEWTLLNLNGEKADPQRAARKGDYLKIDAKVDEYFVQVDRVHVGKDLVQFTVKPSRDPNSTSQNTKHFFPEDSSRTFGMERDGLEVRYFTEGRNESLNIIDQSTGVKDSAMNFFSGLGIMGGMGNLYWENMGPSILK